MANFFSGSSLARISYADSVFVARTMSFARIVCYFRSLFAMLFRFFAFHVSPFWANLCYFLSLCLFGCLLLMVLKPANPSFSPRFVDMLYMSASALTVSGLNSVELENFSSAQIVVLCLLMLVGGEAFSSLLSLLCRRAKYTSKAHVDAVGIELESMDTANSDDNIEAAQNVIGPDRYLSTETTKDVKHSSIRYLGYIVFSYIFLIHVSGSIFILLYTSIVSSARDVLKGKGINRLLFSFFVTVSSFANGGLIPNNENMVIFKTNTGLLLLIIPQILAGNTMFPLFLRLVVWALRKITRKQEFDHMIRNPEAIRFSPLMPNLQTLCLAFTVSLFIFAQVTLYCTMDWNSAVFDGLNSYQKIVNALFMAVNSRHAGEGTLDLSTTSPAVLVLFIIMMYLPGSTSYQPFGQEGESNPREEMEKKKRMSFAQRNIMSQISVISICVIAICITERKKISKDPLNFPVLNIVLEVVSAYGNVGFSTGYSCKRQLVPDGSCEDKWISLSGKWSDRGKLVLIFVLLFGRLKRFTMKAGRAWKLS